MCKENDNMENRHDFLCINMPIKNRNNNIKIKLNSNLLVLIELLKIQ